MKIPVTFLPGKKSLDKKIEHILNANKPFTNKNKLPSSLDCLEIEPRGGESPHLDFRESLKRIHREGYERHLFPWEYFGLIIGHLEGTLQGQLNDLAVELLKNQTGWLSMLIERKKDRIICGINPWYMNVFLHDKMLIYDNKKEFDIKGIAPCEKVSLEQFDDDFVEFFFTRKFKDLPKVIRQKAEINLPYGSPENFACYDSKFSICTSYAKLSSFSRGVRKRQEDSR